MIKKVFRRMTATQIVSAITVTLCLLIDSIVIGRMLGVEAMSAYGLATPVIVFFNAVGTMISVGAQIVTGKAIGKGDQRECRVCFSSSLVMSFVVSIAWIVLVFAATAPLCLMLGAGRPSADNTIYMMTADYMHGYILGAPFFFLSQMMVPYLQAMGKRKLTVISVIIMTIADIVLDLISVYVFHAGMFGIGLASGLSYLASILVGFTYFRKKDCPFKFEWDCVQLSTTTAIAAGGSPVLINQAFFMVRVYVLNLILLSVADTVAVAILSVISTVGNLLFSIGLGTGSVTLMLSTIFYNDEDRTSLYDLVSIMIKFPLNLIISASGIVMLAAPWILRLFLGNDPSIPDIAVPAMRIYIPSLIACVLSTAFKNYYQGIGKVYMTNLISFFNNIFILLIIWAGSLLLGLTGVWVGILAGEFFVLLVISIIVWMHNGSIAFTAKAYSLLEKDFGAAPEDIEELIITDMHSAQNAAQEIYQFCCDKGLKRRICMMVSLCVEEIVMNIIKYGFTVDDKDHSAEVRLVVEISRCVIRIRDNCIGFDPVDYINLHTDDDMTSHMGIKLVTKMVSDINYINSLGLNNLYMVLENV